MKIAEEATIGASRQHRKNKGYSIASKLKPAIELERGERRQKKTSLKIVGTEKRFDRRIRKGFVGGYFTNWGTADRRRNGSNSVILICGRRNEDTER